METIFQRALRVAHQKKDANLNDFSYKTWEKRVLLGKIAGKMKEKYKIYITGA